MLTVDNLTKLTSFHCNLPKSHLCACPWRRSLNLRTLARLEYLGQGFKLSECIKSYPYFICGRSEKCPTQVDHGENFPGSPKWKPSGASRTTCLDLSNPKEVTAIQTRQERSRYCNFDSFLPLFRSTQLYQSNNGILFYSEPSTKSLYY